MISAADPAASWFLLLGGGFFLVIFALPLLFAPLWWARAFQWRLPVETDLTVYLGRCLGAVAVAIAGVLLVAARDPRRHSLLLLLIVAAGALLALVHVWGAMRRVQPWTETVEIAMYAGFSVAAAYFWRSLG